MENQTTAPEVQSEQPKEVAQEQVAEQQTEAKPTVLADATTEQKAEEPKVLNFKEMIPEEYKDEKSLQNFTTSSFTNLYNSLQSFTIVTNLYRYF